MHTERPSLVTDEDIAAYKNKVKESKYSI